MSTGTEASVMTGCVLADRYRVDERIGSGGMGEVWAAWDLRLDRPVAVKLVHPEIAADPVARRRFEAEARISAQLVDPNVVAVYDTGDSPRPYIVMERVPGWTLKDVLAGGPMSAAEARRLAGCMLGALTASRQAGLVHRDIKPSNILAEPGGGWKLGDFGIAKSVDTGTQEETMTGLVVGTPAYLAPERLHGHPATIGSDLFSLGAILYESLTGRRPFESSSTYPWTSAASGTAPLPVREQQPDLDPVLDAVIDQAVQPDPSRRFASPEEMAEALRGGPPARRPPSRKRKGLAIAGATAAAAAAAVTLLASTTTAPDRPQHHGSVVPTLPATPATSAAPSPTTAAAPPTTAAETQVSQPASTTVTRPARPVKSPAGHGPAHHHRQNRGH